LASQNRRANATLASALAAVFLGAVDLTVISTVLPRVVIDLDINTADIDRYIWIVNAYLLAYIVAIPVFGRLSDIAGRRLAFVSALALFGVGSLWTGFSDSLRELIAARALQGAGGGALLPVTMALVGDYTQERRRITTLGLVGAVDTLGWVLGPLWGAAIVGLAGDQSGAWRWVFWINVPISLLIAVSIFFSMKPANARPEPLTGRRLDVVGVLLLGISLLLLNLGFSSGGEAGVQTGSAFRALGGTSNPLADYLPVLVTAGVIALVLFAIWEKKSQFPILSPALFRNRMFIASQSANFLIGAALITAMVDIPLSVALLASEDRISAVSALLFAPFTLLMAAAAFLGGQMAAQLGLRLTAFAGLILVVIGYAAVWLGLRSEDYLWMIPGLALSGFGFGLVIAPIGSAALEQSSDQDRGVAAASTILFRLLGMMIGLSALTAFGIHRLQSLSNKVEPIVRQEGESTADFFVRQSQFIASVAIPLSVKVVRETFLVAGALALLAAIPIFFMRDND
jgi:MFS family permease